MVEAVRSWSTLVRERVRDPVPESVVLRLAEALGDACSLLASAVVLQYDTYVRRSEVLNLLVCDIVKPTNDFGVAFAGMWAVNFAPATGERATKTGQQGEMVVVGVRGRSWVVSVLAAAVADRQQHEALRGDIIPNAYEFAFRKAAARLRLWLALTPQFIRHACSSNDRLAPRLSLEAVRQRGRWSAMQSVLRYEKHAKLLRQASRLTANQRSASSGAASRVRSRLLRFWKHSNLSRRFS